MSRKAKPLTEHLNIRVAKGEFAELHKKSAPDGGVSVVVRQMIEAYLDGRMFIKPKPTSLNQSS
jgi:hypothetical protein